MIDFAKTNTLTLFDGSTNKNVVKVEDIDAGKTLWEATKFRYVSLGDSIAAACNMDVQQGYHITAGEYNASGSHPLNDLAPTLWGEIKNNNQTKIVSNSYTDLIKRNLESSKYGKGHVDAKSYAVSAADNEHLMSVISEDAPRRALSKADLVTVSIGANEILLTAFGFLPNYFLLGDIIGFEHQIYQNLQLLAGKKIDYYDSKNNHCGYPSDEEFKTYTGSYKKILAELERINPTAKYVFTEVYNPYKYLYMTKGEEGFFGALASFIPELADAVELLQMITNQEKPDNLSTTTKIKIRGLVKEFLVGEKSPINIMLDRINQLGDKIEVYVTELNKVLRTAIEEYSSDNGVNNIFLADTKRVYDSIPDGKTLKLGDVKCYNGDTVACAYYDGFDYLKDTDWSRIWGDEDPSVFWLKYIFTTPYSPSGLDSDKTWNSKYKYVKYYTHMLDNPFGGILGMPEQVEIETFIVEDFRGELLAMDIASLVMGKIIGQDIDAHPREYGHEALYRSFADVIRKPECLDIPNMESLTRYTVTYNVNDGSGRMPVQNVVSLQESAFVRLNPLERKGHSFTGWNFDGNALPNYTDAEGRLRYYYISGINSNAAVDAQWKLNKYTLTIVQAYKDIDGRFDVTERNKVGLETDDYQHRVVKINNIDRSGELNTEKAEWSGGSINKEFDVDFETPIEIQVSGRMVEGLISGELPNCEIWQATGEKTADGKWVYKKQSLGKQPTAKFVMPNRDMRVEFYFNYDINMAGIVTLYSHHFWEAYIAASELKVEYDPKI